MDRHKACELAKRVNSHLKVMPRSMDMIRIIYGDQPKAVYSFVDNLAPLDALLDYLQQSHSVLNSWMSSEAFHQRVLIVRAIMMDPPQKLIEDGTLKDFEFIAREVGFTISSIHLNNMDPHVADALRDWLYHIFLGPSKPLCQLEYMVEEMYAERLKPSRMYYPKTAQLQFLDHLLDDLGELLLKPKADNVSLIHLFKFFILPLQLELQEVSCFLTKMPERRKQEADVKDNIANITNLAYEAEYVIDSVLVADSPIWCSMVWLRHIPHQLRQQDLLMKRVFGDVQSIVDGIKGAVQGKHQLVPIFGNNTDIGDTLEEVFYESRYWGYVSTRSIVSSYAERKSKVFFDLLSNVVAYEMHQSTDVIPRDYTSDMREDWLSNILNLTLMAYPSDMSQAKVEESLYNILNVMPSDYTSDMSQAELEELLRNILKDKTYLVILEDVQDIYVLNDIKRVLPESEKHRSVIVFTTPSPELIVQCRYGFNQMFEHYPSTSRTDKPTIEKDVVGFTEETEMMLQQLIGGEPKKLLIISIVGMGGQGKTTLATKLFYHPSVKEHFCTRACCCVSQGYEKRPLLLELLSQIVRLSEADHHGKTNVELAGMLCNKLRKQRFLIFLDDMWKIDAWEDLARCFPDDNNGSRIIFTTRIEELACQAKSDSILQPLSPLSDNESWELLQNKLNLNDCCPDGLLEVGKKIAKNCKGLPLSVVLIAGLLAKIEKEVEQWKYIEESLSSLINAQVRGVIELSYKHLPDHLKSCFLYFGAFLEDREVQVSNLVRLWIGEGLIKHSNSKSLEDVAEDCIRDLVGRSLVTIAQKKSGGGVKSCHVHDLLREFCLIKASEENFLQLLDGYDEHNLSFDHNQELNNSSSSTRAKCHLHRLCIYPERNRFSLLKSLKSCSPYVRSLLFFAVSNICPSYSSDISFIFHNFKFLKILNLECTDVGDSFKEIGHLILLRYLACQSGVDLIPPSIANLWNLQTFVFKGLGDEVVKVSDALWGMIKLRHVHINKSASFDLGLDRLENSSILENLQTFSTPSLAYGDDTVRMLGRIHGIRKLKCMFLDSWNEATNCNQFPELGFLCQLVSLNVFYNGKGKYLSEFNFPSNLKKLTLSNFRMPWNEISQLAQLCKLEVLKLLANAFEGETWEMEDVVFPKLKFLKLDTLNVEEWIATSDNFSILERLVVHNCKQLKEIPCGIGEIETLQMIEVMWCRSSTAISAMVIREEQQEYSRELKIHM